MPDNKQHQEIVIDFDVRTKALEELESTLTRLKKDGQLDNTNGNTFKALMTRITEMKKILSQPAKDGMVGKAKMKELRSGFEYILQSLTKIEGQETSAGMTMDEYGKKVEAVTKKLQEQVAEVARLSKEYDKIPVSGNSPKAKKGRTAEAAVAAVKAHRGGRSGPDTKGESLLRKGNIAAIEKSAQNPNAKLHKEATEALSIYNTYLKDTFKTTQDIVSQLEAAKDKLIELNAEKNDLDSQSGYSEEAIKDLKEQRDAIEEVTEATKDEIQEMEKAGVTHGKVADKNKKLETSTTKAAKSFVKFAVITRTLQKLVKEGIRAVVEMDKALTDMSIVTGESRKSLQAMIPEFNKLGRATGATATEVAGLTAEYMKQGRTMKDAKELAIQTAKAAKISGISSAESVEYMTSAINGFNLAAKDAEHVSDVFAKLGATTATDYKDLAIALSKVSAQANTAGMSMEYTTTLLAKGLEVTQEAPESIGTALKTILARMRELKDYGSTLEDGVSLNKVEKSLSAVGVKLRDTNGQFRDMEDIFTELGPKWDDLTSMQQQSIAQAVAGTRQQSRFLAIMQDWDRTVEMSEQSLNAEGATMYQHSQYAKSLEFSMNKLTTAWQGFISGLTNSDLVRNVLSFAADTLSHITDAIDFLNKISGGLVGTIVTIGAPLAIIVGMVRERVELARKEKAITEAKYQEVMAAQGIEVQTTAQKKMQTEEMRKQNELAKEQNKQYLTLGEHIKKVFGGLKSFGKELKASMAETFNAERENGVLRKMDKQEKKKEKYRKRSERNIKKQEKYKNKIKKADDKEIKIAEKYDAKMTKKKKKAAEREQKKADKQHKKEALQKKTSQEQDQKAIQQRTEAAVAGSQKEAAAKVPVTVQDKAQAEATEDKLEDTTKTAAVDTTQLPTDAAKTVMSEKQADSAEEEADASEDNLNTAREELTADLANLATKKAEEAAEKGEVKARKGGLIDIAKEIVMNASNAIAKIAGATASVVGIPAAVAAAAILAAAGIAGVTVAVAGNQDKRTAKTTEKGNNKIYEGKQRQGELKSLKSELLELQNKDVRTAEEDERLQEITEELQNMGLKADAEGGWIKSIDDEIAKIDEENRKASDKSVKALQKMQEHTWVDDLKTNFDMFKDFLNKIWEGIKKVGDYVAGLWNDFKESKFGQAVSFVGSIVGGTIKGVANLVSHIVNPIKGITAVVRGIHRLVDPEGAEAKEKEQAVKKAKKALGDEQNQQALKNAAMLRAEDKWKEQGLSEEEIAQKRTQFSNQLAQMDWNALAEEHSGDYADFMNGEFVDQMLAANDSINGKGLLQQVGAYNNQQNSSNVDATVKTQLQKSFGNLAYLTNSEGVIADLQNKEKGNTVSDNDILGFAKVLQDNGVSSEQAASHLATLGVSKEDYGSVLESMYDGSYFKDSNLTKEQQNKIIDEFIKTRSGFGGNVAEYRTQTTSKNERLMDVRDTIASGGELSAEQQALLKDDYGELYGNEEFQKALKEKNGVKAQMMINEQLEKQTSEQADKLDTHKIGLNAQLAAEQEKLAAAAPEDKQAIQDQIDLIEAEIQATDDAINEIKNYKDEVAEIDVQKNSIERKNNQIAAIEKKMGENEFNSMKDYEKINKLLEENYNTQEKLFNDKKKNFAKELNVSEELLDKVLEYDEATGEIVINAEEANKLDGVQRQYLEDNIDSLREEYAVMTEIADKQKEINDAKLEAQLEIQNQAIDVMKAQLDAEYEATKASLDKRRELYNKYFDALEHEESAEENADKRQSLLNRIAGLSTATDSDSLAKLKEAQQQLQDLDKEEMQSERDLRRDAVEESFDSQEESLDTQYEEAMKNVQGMWEEFIGMQKEDQEKLFKEYGDSFQEVTSLAAQKAQEELNNYLGVIQNGGVTNNGAPAFADGGLVNYTGPAWVDGTKNRPEAFLDAEDTMNIANLAIGLRSLASNGWSANNGQGGATVAISEFNINVGSGGTQAGQDAANGFMNALREWGININKKD